MRQAMDEVYAARHKEADKVTVGTFPDALPHQMWREAVSEDVIAASGRPDEAQRWMMASEGRDTTYADMADSGEFLTLDMKLAAALSAQALGEIGRQPSLRKAEEKKRGNMVKGRQLLFLVGQYYNTNEEA